MPSLKNILISFLICVGYICLVEAKGQGWDGVFTSLLSVVFIACAIELSK